MLKNHILEIFEMFLNNLWVKQEVITNTVNLGNGTIWCCTVYVMGWMYKNQGIECKH